MSIDRAIQPFRPSLPKSRGARLAVFSILATLATSASYAGDSHGHRLNAHGDSTLLVVERTEDGWQLARPGEQAAKATALPISATAVAHRLSTHSSHWLLSARVVDGAAAAPRMVILRGNLAGDTEIEQLPAPVTSQSVLFQPTVLATEAAEPVAAMWVEGETSQETRVRAALWAGAGWSQSTTISPLGSGSQLALDATRLDDGSLLAVWSGFDGTDDEILWSRLDPSTKLWSQPAALSANDVPDVTPSVTSVAGGALVAWSGYDGADYRIWQRHFDGSDWLATQRLGDKGSISPDYTLTHTGSPVLVFKQTLPAAWRFVQVNADGSVLRSAATDSRRIRPLVESVTDAGPAIRFSPQDQAEKTDEALSLVAWQPAR